MLPLFACTNCNNQKREKERKVFCVDLGLIPLEEEEDEQVKSELSKQTREEIIPCFSVRYICLKLCCVWGTGRQGCANLFLIIFSFK